MDAPRPGLRGKFIIALMVASMLPLVTGVVVLQTAGFRHLLAERGRVHEAEARALAGNLSQAVTAEAGKLRTWIDARGIILDEASETGTRLSENEAARRRETAAIEARWPELDAGDPALAAVLRNPAADSLKAFAAWNPKVAEIIVTDRYGRLVAATGKTSDYDQADELWWQQGIGLEPDGMWTDALQFDESAGVYSLDAVLPLHQDGSPVGTVKAVVTIAPLIEQGGADHEAERIEVLLPDGSVIARRGAGRDFPPLVLTEKSIEQMRMAGEGWTLLPDKQGNEWMTGFSMISSPPPAGDVTQPRGFALFASSRAEVVAPVRAQLVLVALVAGAGVVACMAAGYILIHRQILAPLATLRNAARAVAGSVRLRTGSPDDGVRSDDARRAAEADVERIERIRTGDEIEDLAGDIGVMTARVLGYQRELEEEVAAKTAVIREDLELAREFQQALLPGEYPRPPADAGHRLRLEYGHHYQPASTMGGDFFDLIECSDGRVGVLIADVMGHGARSALVTATLRALARDHADMQADPGRFLTTLNTHLHEVVSRSGHVLFVSAFFMLLDPARGEFRWAVAGHPSPLRMNPELGRDPEPLWERLRRQPALGLIDDAGYRTHEGTLRDGDMFLLYTDGIIEADDPAGKMFGLERLKQAFRDAADIPAGEIPARLVKHVSAFRQADHYEDDVCVVAIRARANRSSPKPRAVATGPMVSGGA